MIFTILFTILFFLGLPDSVLYGLTAEEILNNMPSPEVNYMPTHVDIPINNIKNPIEKGKLSTPTTFLFDIPIVSDDTNNFKKDEVEENKNASETSTQITLNAKEDSETNTQITLNANKDSEINTQIVSNKKNESEKVSNDNRFTKTTNIQTEKKVNNCVSNAKKTASKQSVPPDKKEPESSTQNKPVNIKTNGKTEISSSAKKTEKQETKISARNEIKETDNNNADKQDKDVENIKDKIASISAVINESKQPQQNIKEKLVADDDENSETTDEEDDEITDDDKITDPNKVLDKPQNDGKSNNDVKETNDEITDDEETDETNDETNDEIDDDEETDENKEAGKENYVELINAELKKKNISYSALKDYGTQLTSKNPDNALGNYALALFYYNSKKPNLSKAHSCINKALKAKKTPDGASLLKWKIIFSRFKLFHIAFVFIFVLVVLIVKNKNSKTKKTNTDNNGINSNSENKSE